MSRFENVFGRRHVLLALIRIKDSDQVLRNVEKVLEGGADGAVLLNHGVDIHEQLRAFVAVRNEHPSLWIGLNLLGQTNKEAMELVAGQNVSGLFFDNAGYQENLQDPCEEVRKLFEWRSENRIPQTLIFGGLGFKYKGEPIKDISKAAEHVSPWVDSILTSGESAGFPPTIEKIKALRKGSGTQIITVGGGVTVDNALLFKPYVRCFVVATGISDSPHKLNKTKIKLLSRILKRSH